MWVECGTRRRQRLARRQPTLPYFTSRNRMCSLSIRLSRFGHCSQQCRFPLTGPRSLPSPSSDHQIHNEDRPDQTANRWRITLRGRPLLRGPRARDSHGDLVVTHDVTSAPSYIAKLDSADFTRSTAGPAETQPLSPCKLDGHHPHRLHPFPTLRSAHSAARHAPVPTYTSRPPDILLRPPDPTTPVCDLYRSRQSLRVHFLAGTSHLFCQLGSGAVPGPED